MRGAIRVSINGNRAQYLGAGSHGWNPKPNGLLLETPVLMSAYSLVAGDKSPAVVPYRPLAIRERSYFEPQELSGVPYFQKIMPYHMAGFYRRGWRHQL